MKKRKKVYLLTAIMLACGLLAACGGSEQTSESAGVNEKAEEKKVDNVELYEEKIRLLKEQAVTDEIIWELGDTPAGDIGHAVFISVCDTTKRSYVYTGTAKDLESAWDAASDQAKKALKKNEMEPVWVKADVVYISETVSMEELEKAIYSSRHEFFRYGVAFDDKYETALLEAEMNGAGVFEYEEGGIILNYLNMQLESTEREMLDMLPEQVRVFQCFGWFCDEDKNVYSLDSGGLDYGRRKVETVDSAFVEDMIVNASEFLVNQVQEDGTFIYGYDPRFGSRLEGYNIVRHASTIWSLLCRYRIDPSEELAAKIDLTIEYMLSQLVYENNETAYLYEQNDDEIKLGGCGVAVVALTEYMDVFQNRKYERECIALGNGILAMLDQDTGEYYHVLNGDFSTKEEFRTIYYDGEATFALCRLYGFTREEVWLDAAKSAVDHFIREDYSEHADHWVAYSMNEITKYVTDSVDYYTFALKNALVNLNDIYLRDTTYHTYLELLMATFEVYDRMLESGVEIEGFDEASFLKVIYSRADHMLNGYFFPEYAMYMKNPQQIVNTFMVRHDGYRVRIDDVQHNIGGYYLYYKNYDKLVDYGMLDYRD